MKIISKLIICINLNSYSLIKIINLRLIPSNINFPQGRKEANNHNNKFNINMKKRHQHKHKQKKNQNKIWKFVKKIVFKRQI